MDSFADRYFQKVGECRCGAGGCDGATNLAYVWRLYLSMCKTIQLRRMRPSEAVAVNRLIRKIILESTILNDKAKKSETSKYTPGELRDRIENDPDAVFVAVKGRKAVGFCINAKDDGLLLLEWYGVDRAWRGHGIGHQMMARLIASARRRGCHKVWCDTDVANTGSAKLLCSLGFQPLCTLRNHWYGQDFVLWEMMVPAMAIVAEHEEPAVRPRAKAVLAARTA